jgi:Fur family ferric uptake transcriptional regulator
MNDNRDIRMTESRKAILSVLSGARTHPTADEVHMMVRERLPRVSLGTVYRNLEILAREGMIQTIAAAGERRRYDGTVSEHHHIRCTVCGRVEDVELEPSADLGHMIRDDRGFSVQGYTLCFEGICRECAGNGGGPNN